MANNDYDVNLLLAYWSSVADEPPLSRQPSLIDVNREQFYLSEGQEETAETLHSHDGNVPENIESFQRHITPQSPPVLSLPKSELNRRGSRPYEASIHRKLGRWISFTVTLSLITLCFALVFISWIWLDHKSDRWRALVLSTFFTRIITLTAIGIRVSVSTLAVAATSMIASVALERRGVPMNQAAQVSIARFSNTGPESFFMLLLARESMEWSLRLLTSLLIITSLASQFTSTLLLSDMISEQVALFAENVTVQYDNSNAIISTYVDPSQFENFAEYSEDGTKSEGVDDTGTVLRAFLPIAQQQIRQSLHKYEGLSYVYGAHVLCVRPEFENLRLCTPVTATATDIYLRVCGVIKPKPGLLDGLNVTGNVTRINFSCWIMPGFGSLQPCWIFSPGMVFINNILYPPSYKERSEYGAYTGNTYLLWHINNIRPDIFDFGADVRGNEPIGLFSFNKSGPWLHALGGLANISDLLFLKASLCFDSVSWSSPQQNFIPIVATVESNQTEPNYLGNTDNVKYNTTAIRQQLGATKGDIDKDRHGIFAITKPSVLAALASIYAEPIHNYTGGLTDWVAAAPLNVKLWGESEPQLLAAIGDVLAAVFNDTIVQTNSPAKAVQAYNTILMRACYYRNLDQLRDTTSVLITQYTTALVPYIFRGYLTVIGIVFAHSLLFFIVATLFARTRSSLLGNSWLSLAQLANSPDARDIFKHAAMATDKEVEKWIRSNKTPTSAIPGATTHQNIKAWARRLIRPRTWNVKRIFRRAFWRRRERKAPMPRYVIEDGIFVPA